MKYVELHIPIAVPLTLDDADNVVEVGQPHTCDENPWMGGDVDVWDEGLDEWRKSTDAEINAGYDHVSALLFKRDAMSRPHVEVDRGPEPLDAFRDRAGLDSIADMLRDPEWGSGMLEDIAQIVQNTGRDTEGDGTPTWDRH